MKKQVVSGLVKSQEHAQQLIRDLQSSGFDGEAITVAYENEEHLAKTQKKSKKETNKTKPWSNPLPNSVLGCSLGVLIGVGAFAIPSLRPYMAKMPFAASLAGSAIGGSLGWLVGALANSKKNYEDLESGAILISVHAKNAKDAQRAQDLLTEGKAEISSKVKQKKAVAKK